MSTSNYHAHGAALACQQLGLEKAAFVGALRAAGTAMAPHLGQAGSAVANAGKTLATNLKPAMKAVGTAAQAGWQAAKPVLQQGLQQGKTLAQGAMQKIKPMAQQAAGLFTGGTMMNSGVPGVQQAVQTAKVAAWQDAVDPKKIVPYSDGRPFGHTRAYADALIAAEPPHEKARRLAALTGG